MSTQNVVPTTPAAPPVAAPAVSLPASASPAVTQQPTAPETTATPSSPAALPELRLQDFESTEMYAQALVDRRQQERNVAAAPTEVIADPAKEQQAIAAEAPEKVAPQEGDKSAVETAPAEEFDPTKEPEGLVLDVLDPVSLNERLKANAKLAEALNEDKDLKGLLFATSRLAEKGKKFGEIFIDPESAQAAAHNSAALQKLDNAFFGIKTPEDADNFINEHWMDAAKLTNPDGTPAVDAQGNQQYHPAFGTIMRTITDRGIERGRQQSLAEVTQTLDALKAAAEESGDDSTLTALEAVRESILKPSSPAQAEIPADVKAAQADVARREAELARKGTEAQQAERTRIDNKVEEDCSSRIQSLISPAIDSSSLTDFEKDSVREKAEDAIVAALAKHPYWQSTMTQLMSLPPSDKVAQDRVNLTMRTVQGLAGPIVAALLKTAGGQKMATIQAKEAKVADQIDRTQKTESLPRGPAQPTQALAPDKLFEKLKADFTTQNGEEPSAQQLIEMWAAARRGGQ